MSGFLLLGAALLLPGAAPPVRKPLPQAEFAGGPYCGVYCVYAALRTLDVPVRFDSLLFPQYVGSYFGSSATELKRAIEDTGGKAVVMEALTASALRSATQPIILHVRRPGFDTPHAHWVLYLGIEGDVARIVDPPHPVEPLSFAELLSLWDGVGIVVGTDSADTFSPRAGAWASMTWWLAGVGGCLGVLRLTLARTSARRWPLALVLVPLLALATAAFQHGVLGEGMLRNRGAVGQVVGKHHEPELAKVSFTDAKTLNRQKGAVFLDARGPEAFKQGHIPGSINLPLHSGLAERRRVLETIKQGERVVIYCQSEGCNWGESLAADLVSRGYANVVLYPGGWSEWQAHASKKPDKK